MRLRCWLEIRLPRWLLGVLPGVLLVFPSLSAHSGSPPGAEGNPLDGPALFAKLVPVFEHPRCINCHGVVNPFRKDMHAGGLYDRVKNFPGAYCDDCHDLAPLSLNRFKGKDGKLRGMSEWRLPPQSMFFVDRNPTQLCRQVREFASDLDGLSTHFDRDPRIQLAFEGRRAMDYDPMTAEKPSAQPPDMSYADFRRGTRQWWQEGAAACGYTGTLTVEVDDDLEVASSGSTRQHETVIYHLEKSGQLTWEGRYSSRAKLNNGLHMIIEPGSGSPNVNLNWTERFAANTDGSGTGLGNVEVAVQKDGTYTISYHSVTYPVTMIATGYTSANVSGHGETNSGSETETSEWNSPEGEVSGKVTVGQGSSRGVRLEGKTSKVDDSRDHKVPGLPDIGLYEVVKTTVTWSLDLD